MFDELYPQASEVALEAKLNRPPETQTPRFSTWGMLSAAPKGLAAGAAQAIGSTADMLGAYGSVMGTTGGSAGGMFATQTPEERKQQNEATDKLLAGGPDYMSEGGRLFRNVAKDYTPDPVTTHAAEGAVFNLFRMGSKAITAAVTMGNIPGAIVAGAEEGFTMSDELAQQGVDIGTRTQVGAVNAVMNAGAFALPAAGKTWMQTAALALVGGPVSFITQQAATREILQSADYTRQAEQYDPFDPLGLALSTILPLGFGALVMRGRKGAGFHPPEDIVDAARVSLVRQHMDATNPAPGDLVAADAHVKAYTQAMEQLAAGERVSVDDVAPKAEPTRTTISEPSLSDNPEKWGSLTKDWKTGASDGAEKLAKTGDVTIFKDNRPNWNEGDDGQFFAVNEAGDVVGLVFIGRRNDGLLEGAMEVAPLYRRRGIASAMYDAIEKARGEKLSPAEKHSTYAAAFWENRKAAGPIAVWGAGLKKALDDVAAANPPKVAEAAPAVDAAKVKKKPSSWVILEKETGKVIMETFDEKKVNALNVSKYEAVPILDYLVSINGLEKIPAKATTVDLPAAKAADGTIPTETRLAAIEARNPAALDAEIATDFDDAGRPTERMTVREYLDQGKRDALADTQDAGLLEVAANCFLNGGL